MLAIDQVTGRIVRVISSSDTHDGLITIRNPDGTRITVTVNQIKSL